MSASPTCVRVISCIVFVNRPLVLSEYLESLIVLLHAVRFVVLYRREIFCYHVSHFDIAFLSQVTSS